MFSSTTQLYLHPCFTGFKNAKEMRIIDDTPRTLVAAFDMALQCTTKSAKTIVWIDPAYCYTHQLTLPITLKAVATRLTILDLQEQLGFVNEEVVGCSFNTDVSETHFKATGYLLQKTTYEAVKRIAVKHALKRVEYRIGCFTQSTDASAFQLPAVDNECIYRYDFRECLCVHLPRTASSAQEFTPKHALSRLFQVPIKKSVSFVETISADTIRIFSKIEWFFVSLILCLSCYFMYQNALVKKSYPQRLAQQQLNAFQQVFPGTPIIDLNLQLEAARVQEPLHTTALLKLLSILERFVHQAPNRVLSTLKVTATYCAARIVCENIADAARFEANIKNSKALNKHTLVVSTERMAGSSAVITLKISYMDI